MDATYKDFTYKRYRKPLKWFPWVVVILLVGVGVLGGNLYFGWFKIEKKSDNITLPGVTFWVEQSESYDSKGTAIQYSLESKKQGGAGYVVSVESKYGVVNNADYYAIENGKKYTVGEIKIKIEAPEHKESIEQLSKTFSDNFKVLCDQVEKFEKKEMTAAEISGCAFAAYNKLSAMVAEFDKIQEVAQSPAYSQLILHSNKQLLSIYMLASDSAEGSFAARLKNAACGVIFAYYEFAQSVGANV